MTATHGCHMPHLVDKPGLLQEVLLDHGTFDDPLGCEVHVNVLAKPTRVFIVCRLCIAKGCQWDKSLHEYVNLLPMV